jgi:hypothetical protein
VRRLAALLAAPALGALAAVALGTVVYLALAAFPAPSFSDSVALRTVARLRHLESSRAVVTLAGERSVTARCGVVQGREAIDLPGSPRLLLKGTHVAQLAGSPKHRRRLTLQAALAGCPRLLARELIARLIAGQPLLLGTTKVEGNRLYRLQLGSRPPWLELLVRATDFAPVGLVLRGRSVIGQSRIELRPRPPVPRLKHVLVVVFENKERSEVAGSEAAPTFE